MEIHCERCSMRDTSHCDDCLVTAVLHPPGEPVELDEELEAPLRALGDAGLIPVLRFRPSDAPTAGAPPDEPRSAEAG